MLTHIPYAETARARHWVERYHIYKNFCDQEPTTVCLYTCDANYGGPEEGGWYYESGYPIRTICVFSRKQAIKAAIDLEAYAKSEIGPEKDYLGWPTYRVCFDNDYAKPYPSTRPHYE